MTRTSPPRRSRHYPCAVGTRAFVRAHARDCDLVWM